MSNTKSSGFSLAKQNTISRREWLEKALAGGGHALSADADKREKTDKPERPHLYLVASNPPA
jgi:hypothetical protein